MVPNGLCLFFRLMIDNVKKDFPLAVVYKLRAESLLRYYGSRN